MQNHNIDNVWDTIIQPQVNKIQNGYKLKIKLYWVAHIALLLSVINFAPQIVKTYHQLLPIIWVPNLILIVLNINMFCSHRKKIKSFYNIFLSEKNITHSSKKSDYFTVADILRAKLFQEGNIYFDDVFTGVYKDIPFQIAEMQVEKPSRNSSILIFRGDVLLLNTFLETDSMVVYPKTNYQQPDNYTPEMMSFFKNLSGIAGFQGIIITKEQTFIFFKNYKDKFELIDYKNITKEQFLTVVTELSKKLEIIDKLNIKEKYRFAQTSLNMSPSYKIDNDLNKLASIVLYGLVFGFALIMLITIMININNLGSVLFPLILSVFLILIPLLIIASVIFNKYLDRR